MQPVLAESNKVERLRSMGPTDFRAEVTLEFLIVSTRQLLSRNY